MACCPATIVTLYLIFVCAGRWQINDDDDEYNLLTCNVAPTAPHVKRRLFVKPHICDCRTVTAEDFRVNIIYISVALFSFTTFMGVADLNIMTLNMLCW